MKVHIVKLCQWRIPRRFIHLWMKNLEKELTPKLSSTNARPPATNTHGAYGLKKTKVSKPKDHEITIAFLEIGPMKKLNRNFRSKNKVTDILSFSGPEPECLGELALCGQVIAQQALTHQISLREELGYLLIHGVLHLLGYEHEKSDKKAKIMFELQDELFETLRKKVIINEK